MSFFDKVSKAAKAVGEAVEQQNEKQRTIRERTAATEARLSGKSDKQLKETIKDDRFLLGSSEEEKRAARKILRDRG